jgi:hypothetical protein
MSVRNLIYCDKWTNLLHLDALFLERLCSRLRDIASDAADLELLGQSWVGEDVLDDGATLVASGTKNSDDLGHFQDW